MRMRITNSLTAQVREFPMEGIQIQIIGSILNIYRNGVREWFNLKHCTYELI